MHLSLALHKGPPGMWRYVSMIPAADSLIPHSHVLPKRRVWAPIGAHLSALVVSPLVSTPIPFGMLAVERAFSCSSLICMYRCMTSCTFKVMVVAINGGGPQQTRALDCRCVVLQGIELHGTDSGRSGDFKCGPRKVQTLAWRPAPCAVRCRRLQELAQSPHCGNRASLKGDRRRLPVSTAPTETRNVKGRLAVAASPSRMAHLQEPLPGSEEQADLNNQLYFAAVQGDLPRLRACLAAGADPNQLQTAPGMQGAAPLHAAAIAGHADCVAELLAAGVDPNSLTPRPDACTALAFAAAAGRCKCVAALLSAGASPAAASSSGWSAVHAAARCGCVAALELLLAAQPDSALHTCSARKTPLAEALDWQQWAAARCLLERGALAPAGEVVALLHSRGLQPLYAALVSRGPLAGHQWAHVPPSCTGLGAALPAVLERSAGEAALLVHHLPGEDRQRLQSAALCLSGALHQLSLPALPTPLMWRVLALALAG
ncbi:hypothetical protein ABPG75_009210 [Micractinium tetrahymenae]